MAFPLGTLINAGVIIGGGCIGMLLGDRLPARVRTIVFQGLGLCTLAIGLQMTFKTSNPLYVVGSILLGVIWGELMDLEGRLSRGAESLKRTIRSNNTKFADGFVAAVLLFCIGSMAIMGPLQEGLEGKITIILTKSMLDFFAAIALGAVYGSGVMFSALPLFVYQGGLTLFAEFLRPHLTPLIRGEIEAVGGIMIMGIGFNLLELKHIRLANMLPALIVVVVLCAVASSIN